MTEIKSESGGRVIVSNEILAIIASKAALEVEGVTGIGGYFPGTVKNKTVRKHMPKSVAVAVNDEDVKVAIAVKVEMGAKLHDVSKEVQNRVKAAVETMTGLNVTEVNVRVAAIAPEKRKA